MSHEITNPPSPPFSKGGLGGFENHFDHLILELGNYLEFGICHLGWSRKKSASPFDRLRVNGVTY